MEAKCFSSCGFSLECAAIYDTFVSLPKKRTERSIIMTTHRKAGKAASKVLRSKDGKKEKTAAGSALAQRPKHKIAKTKKSKR
jgi:hypothetical protein